MPYLICDKCGGYYELGKEESIEDFDLQCDCGGNYQYYANKYDYFKEQQVINTNQSESELDGGRKDSFDGFFKNLDA